MSNPRIVKQFADIPVPLVEVGDKVRIREPRDMGTGVVTSITKSTFDARNLVYWITLDKFYHGTKILRHIRRLRREIIKLDSK